MKIIKSAMPLPEIFKTLDESDQLGLNTVWNCGGMPLEGKLKFIEVHLREQPVEIRAAYRKWRFEVDRQTVFDRAFISSILNIFPTIYVV